MIKVDKEVRNCRLPRLSDTRYSAKETKGKWRYAKQQNEIEMRHLTAISYMVMWAVDRFKRYGR